MLVRVLKAPRDEETQKVLSVKDYPKEEWKDLEIMIEAPDYQLGEYNTRYFPVRN